MGDFYAVCDLCAALSLRAIAAKFTSTSDSTMQADIVNYRSKNREATDLGKVYLKAYADHMGIMEGQAAPAASGVVEFDTQYSAGGDWLTHPRRWF